mmetsp:Transcript_49506/g.147852  ORF Transcript_49506/g.147852 Transcript_49506/m.147852 type:complete len:218 (+) Transcript_49506:405-1058(+)
MVDNRVAEAVLPGHRLAKKVWEDSAVDVQLGTLATTHAHLYVDAPRLAAVRCQPSAGLHHCPHESLVDAHGRAAAHVLSVSEEAGLAKHAARLRGQGADVLLPVTVEDEVQGEPAPVGAAAEGVGVLLELGVLEQAGSLGRKGLYIGLQQINDMADFGVEVPPRPGGKSWYMVCKVAKALPIADLQPVLCLREGAHREALRPERPAGPGGHSRGGRC